MKNILIILLSGALAYLVYAKHTDRLPMLQQQPAPADPRAPLIAAIDQKLTAFLAPIPMQQKGTLAQIDAQQEVSRIRHDLLEAYSGATAADLASRQATNRLCDLLLLILSERNAYIRRVNDARANTHASALVDSGYNSSGSSLDRLIKQRNDAIARKEELARRVQWWETTLSRQWDTRSDQLRREVDSQYARFRAALKAPPAQTVRTL